MDLLSSCYNFLGVYCGRSVKSKASFISSNSKAINRLGICTLYILQFKGNQSSGYSYAIYGSNKDAKNPYHTCTGGLVVTVVVILVATRKRKILDESMGGWLIFSHKRLTRSMNEWAEILVAEKEHDPERQDS